MLRNTLAHEIAHSLKGLRYRSMLTQRELAEKTGLKQSAIARIEKGQAALNIKTLEKIAKAYGAKVIITFQLPERLT